MSEFPQFDNAKLMIAASVQHCRILIEELPVGQIVVDENGVIRSIDPSTQSILGFESIEGWRIVDILVDGESVFPTRLSSVSYGDLGDMIFLSIEKTLYSAKVVCVPGPHQQTFLLSLIFV